jgi:hypothetical protein
MRENVAAQETIARAQDELATRIAFLNKVLVVLTVLLLLLALPDAVMKVRDFLADWQAASAWEAWASDRH